MKLTVHGVGSLAVPEDGDVYLTLPNGTEVRMSEYGGTLTLFAPRVGTRLSMAGAHSATRFDIDVTLR